MKNIAEPNNCVLVFPCCFRRKVNSKVERGIAIGDLGSIEVIIDSKFRAVPAPIWDCTSLHTEGCLRVDI